MKRQQGLPATPSQASGLRGGRGQTLLEILLAFSVSILVLSAVILGVVTSLNNAQYTKNQGLANSYAQEGMAAVKKIRDSSLYDYSSYGIGDLTSGVKYCINKKLELKEIPFSENCLSNPFYGSSLAIGAGGIFSREVRFNHDSEDCSGGSKTTVKVSWTDSKCPADTGEPLCHSVELITCFSNIDLKQAP